ncbi:hypothetical protein EYR38_006951 [Pleurotus pulmonarius]|nr:hypothetical protein EYR38_006951 [Pleurotus pulmonarius]
MPSAANVNPGARQMAKGSGGPRRKPPRHPQNVEAGGQATSNNTNGNSTKKTKPKRSEVPCKAWKAGSCARGTKCWFRHDLEAQQDRNVVVQVNQLAEQVRKLGLNDREQEEQRDVLTHEEEQQRDERRRHQEARERRGHREQARIADEQRIQKALLEREATRQARLDEQAVRKARDAEYLTRMADISQEEATRMTKHFILGSLVTFGAGLDIRHLITGFECCTVQIKNLPAEVSEAEIANIFLDQGIEAGRFQILENQATSGRRRTAKFITDAEIGEVMALGLEGVVFREDKLDLEVGPYNLPGRMGASGVRDTDTVTISWKAPSTRFIAEFDDMETTRRQAQALNRKVFMGRRVKVVVNTPPRGRKIPLFNPRSVIISNLDPDVDRQSIRDFTGATVVEEMRPGFAQQSGHLDFDALSCYIAEISTGLVSLENLNNFQKTLDGMVTVKARFNSREEAERVYLLLSKGTFPWSINMLESTFWLHLPALMQYTLTIPAAQYSAQKHQWDSLVESIKHRNACNLFITGLRAVDVVQMRIVGNVKEAVGALKVRVENLAAGEKIEGWHPSLGHSRSQFIRAVVEDTGGFLRADHRQKVLKAYGKPDDVDAIRTMVAAELQKLASKEWSFTLQKQSVGFFIRQGVPALQEMFGDENVLFNATSRIITVRGEEARHTLKSFISQSVEAKIPVAASIPAEQICPVCYDRVSDPAEESDKFPLTCVGEECGELIPIPIVQRFLTPADFARLLEAAFTFHLDALIFKDWKKIVMRNGFGGRGWLSKT